jgi:2-polyprenyl-3-methyl-5-hydroxy-6-metoxy-1,4-benzoquinol methylase
MMKWLISRLDNPLVWRSCRWLMNLTFGLYRRRFHVLERWGVLEDNPSVLDIGCGIGQYAKVTNGPYLGVDLNERYVKCAARTYRKTDRVFRCADVTKLWEEKKRYNLVLMVDFLHHIPDDAAVRILKAAAALTNGKVASFEPIKQQTNFVSQWIIDHDRGEFMRSLDDLHRLFARAGLSISESVDVYLGPIRTRAILCRRAESVSVPHPGETARRAA